MNTYNRWWLVLGWVTTKEDHPPLGIAFTSYTWRVIKFYLLTYLLTYIIPPIEKSSTGSATETYPLERTQQTFLSKQQPNPRLQCIDDEITPVTVQLLYRTISKLCTSFTARKHKYVILCWAAGGRVLYIKKTPGKSI